MNEMIEQLKEQCVMYGPNLLAGLAVLVVGWLVAVFLAFLARKLLGKTSVDNRIAQWLSGPDASKQVPVERWFGNAVFYLVMLIVLVAFFSTIKLTMVTEPLNDLLQPVLAYLPRLIGAGLLLLVAWGLATVLRKVLLSGMQAAKLDEKLGGAAVGEAKPVGLSQTFAEVVYWLVFLIFLPIILQTLALQGLLEPVITLFNKVFAFLPNLLSGAAILLIGWFVARIAQRIVQSLLASAGTDKLSEKWGLAPSLGKQKLSGVLGLVVYFVILVPVLISALSAIQLEAVTKPASDMLGKTMSALPDIVGAGIVILIAVVIGKVVAGIVTNVLAGVGFNNVLVKLGLAKQAPAEGSQSPAGVVGMLALALIVLLASVTAANMLGFQALGVLITDFIGFAGHILMGVVIFGLGLLLAQIVTKMITASDARHARRLALVMRVVILALAGAMALRQTGLADDIVNLAFGLTLGAAAVAFALAFGLGGREMASRALEEWRSAESKDHPKS